MRGQGVSADKTWSQNIAIQEKIVQNKMNSPCIYSYLIIVCKNISVFNWLWHIPFGTSPVSLMLYRTHY